MCDCGTAASRKIGRYIDKGIAALGGEDNLRGAWNVGKQVFKGFKKFTGRGDYSIVGNSLMESALAGIADPAVMSSGRATRVTHKEYIGEVTTHPSNSQLFNGQTFELNPGNMITFPWLSTIALQYEQYIPMGIVVEFISSATDTTTSASLGTVTMATEYNVTTTNYTSKREMMQSAYSSDSKLTNDQMHGIECAPSELQRKVFYVRNFNPPADYPSNGSSKADYDMGKTTVAVSGSGLEEGSSVGSLYIHYDFIFIKPQPYGGLQGMGIIQMGWKSDITLSDISFSLDLIDMEQTTGPDLQIQIGSIYDDGAHATVAGNGITFPANLQGAQFHVEMMYSQVLHYVAVAVGNQTLTCTGCKLIKVNDFPNEAEFAAMPGSWLIGENPDQYLNMLAPRAVTGQTANTGSGYCSFDVKLDEQLTIPASLDFDISGDADHRWGFFPATFDADGELYIKITMTGPAQFDRPQE